MKMPDTIFVGVATSDADFVDPRFDDGYLMMPSITTGAIAARLGEEDSAVVGEYRFVRLVEVSKTIPAPVVTVKEVQ